jgi:hypothetical protein
VNKYIEAWPQIPREELHASAVQHPCHPEYRWLLNTRRVPVQASSSDSDATEHELPKCAGVGIKEQPLWLCKSCTKAPPRLMAGYIMESRIFICLPRYCNRRAGLLVPAHLPRLA